MSSDVRALDVSVVVPVYNPGPYIDVLIDGLLSQTLSRDRFEVIFVDDGSTDETPARLDALAAEHEWITVIHQPNSGWPGQPRNLGTDHARGDYVFFSDHDDRLGPEALERIVAMARRNDVDMLVPKMVSRGRPVPRGLFRANIDHAVLGSDPLIQSSTPHKLFRRAWLIEHGLRFPEGRRRLEDGVFVMDAYLHAKSISVLADYPCYYRYGRDDGGNAAKQPSDPKEYYGYVEEIIDVIDRNTGADDPLRRAMYQRPYNTKMLSKLFGKRLFSWSPDMRETVFAEIRQVMLRRFPADFPNDFPLVHRAHLAALYANRLDRMAVVAGAAAAIETKVTARRVRWHGERWTLQLRAELTFADGLPIRILPVDGGWAVDERLIPADLSAAPHDEADILKGARVDVTVIHVDERVEWFAATDLQPKLVPIADDPDNAHRLVFRGTADLAPATLAGGRPLEPGRWNVRGWVSAFGVAGEGGIELPRRLLPSLALPVLAGDPPAEFSLTRNRRVHTAAIIAPGDYQSPAARFVEHAQGVQLVGAGRIRMTIGLAIAASAVPNKLVLVLLDDDDLVVARRIARITTNQRGSVLTSEVVDRDRGMLPFGTFRVALLDGKKKGFLLARIEVDRFGRVRLLLVVNPKLVKLRGDRPKPTSLRVVHRLERDLLKGEATVRRYRDRLRTARSRS